MHTDMLFKSSKQTTPHLIRHVYTHRTHAQMHMHMHMQMLARALALSLTHSHSHIHTCRNDRIRTFPVDVYTPLWWFGKVVVVVVDETVVVEVVM